jgi:hypothetical protein
MTRYYCSCGYVPADQDHVCPCDSSVCPQIDKPEQDCDTCLVVHPEMKEENHEQRISSRVPN